MQTRYLEILKQYWGYDSFRGIQEQIIGSIGEGKDTLGLMPTGGGKSICFQVPALAMQGLCIVVSPLIALMRDQISRLKSLGIKAEMVHSGMYHDDILRIIDNCILGDYKFLYISPERLATDIFRAKMLRLRNISFVAVDEAHCISQWGYDFRPSYLKIAEFLSYLPTRPPVLALTATATPRVVSDITDKLEFRNGQVFKMSFERKNLIYVVRHTRNKLLELSNILTKVNQGSAIIYVRNRELTYELAQYLKSQGLSAENFHAGLTPAEKFARQENWTKNRIRIMVATNAFGMGIDKEDVRVVIHFSAPDSLEAYFQEAGRAGRDGGYSYAVLLCDERDESKLKAKVNEAFPEKEYIREVYEEICNFLQIGINEACGRTFYFNMEKYCRVFRKYPTYVESALKILTTAGYIEYHSERELQSRVHVIMKKEDLYHLSAGSDEKDTVLSAMFRLYTGLFADFVTIHEKDIADSTQMTEEQVYQCLKALRNERVIDYVPRVKTPTITFILPRQETRFVNLMPNIYSQRKETYAERIKYMANYFSTDSCCRSRYMLKYFGDDTAKDCGQCDVCIMKKK